MNKAQATRMLRAALADLYPARGDAERIVVDAGLTLAAIAFNDKAVNSWHNILSEAEKQRKVLALLALAREEYPEDEALAQAATAYQAATGETLGDDASPAAHQGLRQLLAQHQHNLQLLQVKKAVYAAGEEPLSLLNQIEAEEKTIQALKQQLGE